MRGTTVGTEVGLEVFTGFKCLDQLPNMCSAGGWMPVFFWVTYTLLITFMIMNLVIAVILEGYEDGKPTREGVVIDKCVLLWRTPAGLPSGRGQGPHADQEDGRKDHELSRQCSVGCFIDCNRRLDRGVLGIAQGVHGPAYEVGEELGL
ncbi:unnamed protein product [Prorocentrum cordatum]|uniref:Ion transport domain-containing protein n=1 Tax=Prorocentrum cordatum TaxID=2364126 RepID=A0ABN9SNA5_9DINO|nr:unnamed protein product [Polarella glacialis]